MKIGEDEVLSLSAAAKRIGISRKTLWHQINAGKVEAERSGDVWLVKASVIDIYAATRKGKRGRPRKPENHSE